MYISSLPERLNRLYPKKRHVTKKREGLRRVINAAPCVWPAFVPKANVCEISSPKWLSHVFIQAQELFNGGLPMCCSNICHLAAAKLRSDDGTISNNTGFLFHSLTRLNIQSAGLIEHHLGLYCQSVRRLRLIRQTAWTNNRAFGPTHSCPGLLVCDVPLIGQSKLSH